MEGTLKSNTNRTMSDEILKEAFLTHEIELSSLLEAELDGFLPALGQAGFLDVELRETLLNPHLLSQLRAQHVILKLHKAKLYVCFLHAMEISFIDRLEDLAVKISDFGAQEIMSIANSRGYFPPPLPQKKCTRPGVGVELVPLVSCQDSGDVRKENNLPVGNHPNQKLTNPSMAPARFLKMFRKASGDKEDEQYGTPDPVEVPDSKWYGELSTELVQVWRYAWSMCIQGLSPCHTHPGMKYATGDLKTGKRGVLYSFMRKRCLKDSMSSEEMVKKAFNSTEEILSPDLKFILADAGLTRFSTSRCALPMLYEALTMSERGCCDNYEIITAHIHSHIAHIHAHSGDLPQAKFHTSLALQLAMQICDPAVVDALGAYGWILFLEHDRHGNIPEYVERELDHVYGQCMSMLRMLPKWYCDGQPTFGMGKADIHLRIAKSKIDKGAMASDPEIYQLLQRAQDTLNTVDNKTFTQDDSVTCIAFYNQLWFHLHHLRGNSKEASRFSEPAVDYWIRSASPTGDRLAKEVAEMSGDVKLLQRIQKTARDS